MLFKDNPSFKLFLQNTLSIKTFIRECKSDDFKLTKEDILNYNTLSSEIKISILNTKLNTKIPKQN